MTTHTIYTYEKKNLFQTKGFDCLKVITSYQYKKTIIVCHSKKQLTALETYFLDVSPLKQPIIITLDEFISQYYSLTLFNYKDLLTLYFNLFLLKYNQEKTQIPFSKDTILIKNFIKLFINISISKQKNLQTHQQTGLYNSPKDTIMSLYLSFSSFLQKKTSLPLTGFYNIKKRSQPYNSFTQLFFITPDLQNICNTHSLPYICSLFEDVTWIIKHPKKYSMEWIYKTFSNVKSITEKQKKKETLSIFYYNQLEEELLDVCKQIKSFLTASKKGTVGIICPSNQHYIKALSLILIKENLPFKSNFTTSPITLNLLSCFDEFFNFCLNPFTLSACAKLCHAPWLNTLSIETNKQITPDFERLATMLKKYSFSVEPEQLINHIETLLKNKKINKTKEKKESLETFLITHKKIILFLYTIHKNIRKKNDYSTWLTILQHFFNSIPLFEQKSLQYKELQYTKKSLFDFISLQLLYLQNMKFNLKPEDFIPLLQKQINLYFYSPYIQAESIQILNIESYINQPFDRLFVLGISKSTYHINKHQDYLEPYILQHKQTIECSLDDYLFELPLEKHTQFSFSKTIYNEFPIPLTSNNYTIFPIEKTNALTYSKTISVNEPLPTPETCAFSKLNITSISTTMLDIYQRCPYKYWLISVLQLSPKEDEKVSIPATDWGSFIHLILQTFNEYLMSNPGTPTQQYYNTFYSIAEHAFSRLEQNFFWSQKKEIFFGNNLKKGILHNIVDIYQNYPFFNSPLYVEKPFNFSIDNISISCKIDAVFDTDEGPIIIDYKTGKSFSTAKDTETLRQLQLPLYLFALSQHHPTLAQSLSIFQIYNADKTNLHINSCTANTKKILLEGSRKRPFIYNEQLNQRCKQYISTLLHLIKSNFFKTDFIPALKEPHSIRKNYCLSCSFNLSCRYSKASST